MESTILVPGVEACRRNPGLWDAIPLGLAWCETAEILLGLGRGARMPLIDGGAMAEKVRFPYGRRGKHGFEVQVLA